ncbi:unnamed protein product [Polarella glacialis]|uniref:C3H1-type domain-containing protein n=2 Tax=Polarella glacialis TaxID=89957 RepID=A0A813EYY2_POLGL|nr:unnamed protein product [Polarella glacialis]
MAEVFQPVKIPITGMQSVSLSAPLEDVIAKDADRHVLNLSDGMDSARSTASASGTGSDVDRGSSRVSDDHTRHSFVPSSPEGARSAPQLQAAENSAADEDCTCRGDPLLGEIGMAHRGFPAGLPSQGSVGHWQGRCKPCAFLYEGCENGFLCEFCHLCPPGEIKRRKRLKIALKRRITRGKDTKDTPSVKESN